MIEVRILLAVNFSKYCISYVTGSKGNQRRDQFLKMPVILKNAIILICLSSKVLVCCIAILKYHIFNEQNVMVPNCGGLDGSGSLSYFREMTSVSLNYYGRVSYIKPSPTISLNSPTLPYNGHALHLIFCIAVVILLPLFLQRIIWGLSSSMMSKGTDALQCKSENNTQCDTWLHFLALSCLEVKYFCSKLSQ